MFRRHESGGTRDYGHGRVFIGIIQERQSEITEFNGFGRIVDQNVLRLQVPVQNAILVRVCKRCRGLNPDVKGLKKGQAVRMNLQQGIGASIQIFQYEVRFALPLAPGVDLHNIRMLTQIGKYLRFLHEAPDEIRILALVHQLNRSIALELRVTR